MNRIRKLLVKNCIFEPIFIALIITTFCFLILFLDDSPEKNMVGLTFFLIASITLTIIRGHQVFSQKVILFSKNRLAIKGFFSLSYINHSDIISVRMNGRELIIETIDGPRRYIVINEKTVRKFIKKV